MIKGIYKSASAMIPRIKKQDTIANNLANASSPGFKKDMVFTEELSRAETKRIPKQTDWQQPMIDQVYTNFEQGGMDKTGNVFDIALEGAGFFQFVTPEGQNLLSRAGNLTVDNEGYIANSEGDRLLSNSGPLSVGGGSVSIAESGQVVVDSSDIGTIQVVVVENPNQLIKTGNNSFKLPDGVELAPAVRFAVRQGYLESSNVEVISEMIDMIASYRNFEADANAIKAQDETLEKLFANVGRVR